MIDLKNKRILITGGSGSIGTYLIEMLDESNKILNIDLNLPDNSIKEKSDFVEVDLANKKKVEKIVTDFKPEILFHLAAVFQRTKETIDFRHQCYSSNVVGTHNIFESCVKMSVESIIFPSSYLIYDDKKYLFDKNNLSNDPIALSEDSPINPRNITGVAKLYAERELEFYEQMGIKTTSLRIFRVYGPKNLDIIDRWIKILLMGKEITVYGKEQVFDYVHAKDCAIGCIQAAKSQKNGIFNIASGVPTSVNTVLKILKNEFGDNITIKDVESTDIEKYEKSYANLDKSKKLLNYEPTITIEEGISMNIKEIKRAI